MEYINIKKLIDIIRKEYRQHANTKERVANVLDEILKFTYDNYQVKGEYVTNDALLEYLNGKVNTDGSNIEDIETWQLVLDFYSKNESDLRYKSIDYIPSWSEITDKPSSFNPSPHNHSIGDVDGLNDQINLIKTDIEIINEEYMNLLQEVDEVLQALDNKEDKSNKQNSLTPDGTGTKYPTVDTVNNALNLKLDKPSLSTNTIPIWNSSYGNFSNTNMTFINGKFGISVYGEPSETLEVAGGNIKGTLIKDQYGTLRSQRVITVTGNTTLSEIHNGAILHITNTCNITIPTGLGADFSCDCYVKGAFIATFVNSGVTLNAPSGLRLKTDKMATLYSNASDVFNLLGELATS